MTWQWQLFAYVAGLASTGVVLATTMILAARYHRELPKKPIVESIEALEERRRQTAIEYDVLREKLAAAQHDIHEGERWKTWVQDQQLRIEELKREEQLLHDVESKVANLKEEQSKVEQTIRELREREAGLKVALADYDEKARRIDELRKECDALAVQRTQKLEETTRLEGQAKRIADEMAAKVKSLEDVSRDLEQRKASLTTVTGEHAKLVAECRGLEASKKALEEDQKRLQGALTTLQREREILQPAEADAGKRLSALWKPVFSQDEFRKGVGQEAEERMLARLTEHCRAKGMKFHDRVVRAFHTSLKISKESPLVVLAGISGTGKSALPRLYAEGMGMYFLNVSVQPSWDSPMDMLGFYNHLESRFRPTDLTRALVQMDQFAGEAGRWPRQDSKQFESLSDRMLLVLLDEMNLARVEYYFSEFLSKLEFRRDIDERSAASRRKAEILLETGAAAGEAQHLPLFPGTNVLFVGTMNEDESTQALSDKVVDRANVLRFGMPANLKPAELNSGAPLSPTCLEHPHWRKWLRDGVQLDLAQESEVDGFIDECNHLLERIGKPFAYRTANSVRAYVRNYPRASDAKWVKSALADQVEQKVLPKLRGLDLQDAAVDAVLDGVKKIVGRLGDGTLEEAIDEGRDQQRGHQFVWRGIDRAAEVEE